MALDEKEIQQILNTFEKMNLASRHGERYFAPKISTTTTQDVLDDSIRRFQKEMLQYHASQIGVIPIELRETQTMILPMPRTKLKKAKLVIRKFFNDFESKYGTANTTEIYSLSLQLTPVTSIKAKK